MRTFLDANIFEFSKTDTVVVAHGVDVHGRMGAGLANLVAGKYPSVKKNIYGRARAERCPPVRLRFLKLIPAFSSLISRPRKDQVVTPESSGSGAD